MNKKAALSLSINAIVIIVIAFVVLGLGLTLTKTIFAGAREKLPEAFSLTELEKVPSSEDPLTITSRISIKRLKTKEISVGYYNKDPDMHGNVRLDIPSCYAVGEMNITPEQMPKVTSIAQDVGGSSAVGYKIIIKENGFLSGQYVCELVAEGTDPNTNETKVWESDQFYLQVTT